MPQDNKLADTASDQQSTPSQGHTHSLSKSVRAHSAGRKRAKPSSPGKPQSVLEDREFLLKWEERLTKWEEFLQQEKLELQHKEADLFKKSHEAKALEEDLLRAKEEYIKHLQEVSKLPREQAQERLLKEVEKELQEEMAKRIRQIEEEVKRQADERSREILVDAMRHGFSDYIPEYTISEVRLPDPNTKGRVIGREGRNIRALEKQTGVDVEIDEEEPVIRLSSFDPIRREVARVALTRLIKDRRVHPARIEEVVEATRKEIDGIIEKAGEDLCHRAGVYNLPEELVKLLGRFKFRFSYGQNLMTHTLEETRIGIALAHELGADVETVRLGCLLHDLGKVVVEREGNHLEKGVTLLKRHNLSQTVVDCVAQHHEDVPFTSIEAIIVYLADSISGARPGARYESYEEYVKRINTLEEVTKGFEGVEEAYAIQAGRELRVIVAADKVDDDKAVILAREIRKAVEKAKVGIPGNVQITVLREFRVTETAQT